MKTIIAGSRHLDMTGMLPLLFTTFDLWEITEVVSGHSGNVDLAGEEWAANNNIPVTIFKANWNLGRSAGPKRNRQMAAYADALYAVWDGKSRGTLNMIEEAKKNNLRVCVTQI